MKNLAKAREILEQCGNVQFFITYPFRGTKTVSGRFTPKKYVGLSFVGLANYQLFSKHYETKSEVYLDLLKMVKEKLWDMTIIIENLKH